MANGVNLQYKQWADILRSYANRRDSDFEVILPTLTRQAERRIWDELRYNKFESSQTELVDPETFTTLELDNYTELLDVFPIEALPSPTIIGDYLEGRRYPSLRCVSLQAFNASEPSAAAYDSAPFLYARQQDELLIRYVTGKWYIKVIGYGSGQYLYDAYASYESKTFIDEQRIYIAAAMAEIAAWGRDEKQIAVWEQKYQQAMQAINARGPRFQMSGSTLSIDSPYSDTYRSVRDVNFYGE